MHSKRYEAYFDEEQCVYPSIFGRMFLSKASTLSEECLLLNLGPAPPTMMFGNVRRQVAPGLQQWELPLQPQCCSLGMVWSGRICLKP